MLRICTALVFVVCVMISTTSDAFATIFEFREYRGKQIACGRSGLQGWGRSCGTEGNYAYILIGSVLSVTELPKDEKRLQIIPQEVFLGDAPGQLTITTSQGACIGEINPGDQWLFYLWRNDNEKDLHMGYGDPSVPIAQAESIIATLRRLSAMSDTGLIKGSIAREVQYKDEDGNLTTTSVPIPNHKVLLKRDNGVEYSAFSDKDGVYEFDPIPSGSYYLSANTTSGLWAKGGTTMVQPHSCTSYNFDLHTDGSISGHVKSANGKPFEVNPPIVLTRVDHSASQSSYVDDQGNFAMNGLEPGRYLLGINLDAQPNTPEWRSRVYYPGVRTEEEATIIELGKSQKLKNIDFWLPESSAP